MEDTAGQSTTLPTRDNPWTAGGLELAVIDHNGHPVIWHSPHLGEVSTGPDVDALLAALREIRPHLTDKDRADIIG